MMPTRLVLCALVLAGCATTTATRLDPSLPTAAVERPPATSATETAALQQGGGEPTEAPPASPRAGRDEAAAKALGERLATLTRCERGATVGQLTLALAGCTRMACPEACCNACSWTASFVSTNGVPQPVAPERLRDVLGLTERALECEVVAWNGVLRGKDVGLDGAGCLVR